MRKTFILLYTILILLFAPTVLPAVTFKVASYNVENLFDEIREGNEYDNYIPGRHNWNAAMVETKLNHTAEVLCDMNADIVALQEVENESILLRLRKRLAEVGCSYRYAEITHKRSATIQVALLSKYPIVAHRELRVNYSPRDRNILEATVRIENNLLTLFVNHWKSKSRSGFESRRIVYAKALMKRIAKLPKGRDYIILGDLNSHYDAYRVLGKRINDTQGKTGINTVLMSAIDGDMVSEEDIVLENDHKKRHYNLWMELPPSERWSHRYYGHKGAIDHIMLPHSLFDGKGIDYVNNSFSSFRERYLFTKKGWIYGWDYSNGKHKGRGYSDHLPIYAVFSTEAYKAERREAETVKSIEDLYTIEKLKHSVKLMGCSVILKRGDNAVIKHSYDGMAIYIYGAAGGLKEGMRYDLVVSEIGRYKGLKEIVGIEQAKAVGSSPVEKYYLSAKQLHIEDPSLQNQVFVKLLGRYSKGRLDIGGEKIAIYFKGKKWRPDDGSRIKIRYAHLGFYNKPQLLIHDKDDFELLDKR